MKSLEMVLSSLHVRWFQLLTCSCVHFFTSYCAQVVCFSVLSGVFLGLVDFFPPVFT
jgi:hypothetical protein